MTEPEIIGVHPKIKQMDELITRVARSPARSVLIYGETGTGKGLVARSLHMRSNRSRKNFVDMNCAAIPSELLESELFGHEKGAFTGALTRKRGLLELGNGGTVFLDEIRELQPAMQAKLLSLMDAQQFRPVGSLQTIKINVRFITATNRLLFKEVEHGRFREDLYYRLLVASILIPPLRERGEDILILTEHFLRKFSQEYGRVIRGIEPAAREIFLAYKWPGNVRELENLVERILLLGDGDMLTAAHIPTRVTDTLESEQTAAGQVSEGESRSETLSFHEEVQKVQRKIIRQSLEGCGGNITAAAALCGLSRHAFRHYRIKLFGSPT